MPRDMSRSFYIRHAATAADTEKTWPRSPRSLQSLRYQTVVLCAALAVLSLGITSVAGDITPYSHRDRREDPTFRLQHRHGAIMVNSLASAEARYGPGIAPTNSAVLLELRQPAEPSSADKPPGKAVDEPTPFCRKILRIWLSGCEFTGSTLSLTDKRKCSRVLNTWMQKCLQGTASGKKHSEEVRQENAPKTF